MKDLIRALADRYAAELKLSTDTRVTEMEQDDRSHVLSVQGEYHYGEAAWAYVKERTDFDLLGILKELAAERTGQHGQ